MRGHVHCEGLAVLFLGGGGGSREWGAAGCGCMAACGILWFTGPGQCGMFIVVSPLSKNNKHGSRCWGSAEVVGWRG